jgi:uncharacterized LabA/DUF88 family protein
LTETRLKIAVFIDFDNIEIGVKTTLGQQFDIAAILEGIKERGEVVTKVAYGDWKRAGEHGRLLSQHAIRMVQRNLTPGGDKNGADINLALDALEMAFTHDHINAFVIVGGDSDFITLVEKLKQYDKKVFVVGGRQFTSLVMQKNCHEFIAYENLVSASRRSSGGGGERRGGGPVGAVTDVSKALPLVRRALKVLADREVSPQLGLLKSTLLQLDSTYSERDYGASTFRDFIEKVAQTGVVTLRHAGRSLLVDLAEDGVTVPPDTNGDTTPYQPAERADGDLSAESADGRPIEPRPALPPAVAPDPDQAAAAVQRVRDAFASQTQQPRWPMYVRQVKQFLRAGDEGFDERKYGFNSIVDFLRACQREGVLRLERDRQGVLRVFPGGSLKQATPADGAETEVDGNVLPASEAQAEESQGAPDEPREGYGPMAELLAEAAEPMLTIEAEIPPPDDAADAKPEKVTFIVSPGEPDEIDPEDLKFNVDPELLPKPKRAAPSGGRKGGGGGGRGPRKPAAGPRSAGPRTPRAPRGRKKAE